MFRFLSRETGRYFGNDTQRWMKWVWQQPYDPHPEYLAFKRTVSGIIDPRMADFFPEGTRSLIRLDEVQWGGVQVNGIPPLDQPKHIPATRLTISTTNTSFSGCRSTAKPEPTPSGFWRGMSWRWTHSAASRSPWSTARCAAPPFRTTASSGTSIEPSAPVDCSTARTS